jgi:hypothetical protein
LRSEKPKTATGGCFGRGDFAYHKVKGGYDFASSLNSSSSDITFQFQFPVPVSEISLFLISLSKFQ